jgi:hypothetical protein
MGHKKFGVQVSVQLPPSSKARAELMAVDAGVRAAEIHRRVYEAGLEALDAGGVVSGWRERIGEWEEMTAAASVEARRRRALTAGKRNEEMDSVVAG